MSAKSFGRHILVDLFECDAERIQTVESVRPIFLDAAEISGATVLGDHFHQFDPVGVSGVILIAESHFSLHTWPEDRYAAMDVFTCGDQMDPELAIDEIERRVGAGRREMKEFSRGRLGALVRAESAGGV